MLTIIVGLIIIVIYVFLEVIKHTIALQKNTAHS